MIHKVTNIALSVAKEKSDKVESERTVYFKFFGTGLSSKLRNHFWVKCFPLDVLDRDRNSFSFFSIFTFAVESFSTLRIDMTKGVCLFNDTVKE